MVSCLCWLCCCKQDHIRKYSLWLKSASIFLNFPKDPAPGIYDTCADILLLV